MSLLHADRLMSISTSKMRRKHWLSPPDRREITLLLLCTLIFILFYNIGQGTLTSSIPTLDSFHVPGLTSTSKALIPPGADGRRPKEWRDKLEDFIAGTWAWNEGFVSGDGKEREQAFGADRAAIWIRREESKPEPAIYGEGVVRGVFRQWGYDFPTTTIVKHIPGELRVIRFRCGRI